MELFYEEGSNLTASFTLFIIVSMAYRENHLKEIVSQIQRIVDKHLQIDKIHLPVEDGLMLAPGEIHALQAIGENQGCNMTALGNFLGVTKSAASQMATRLERKDVVKRIPSPESGKEVLLFLTDMGQRAFMEYHAFNSRHMGKLFKRLKNFSDSELSDTSAVLSEFERTANERVDELFRFSQTKSGSRLNAKTAPLRDDRD